MPAIDETTSCNEIQRRCAQPILLNSIESILAQGFIWLPRNAGPMPISPALCSVNVTVRIRILHHEATMASRRSEWAPAHPMQPQLFPSQIRLHPLATQNDCQKPQHGHDRHDHCNDDIDSNILRRGKHDSVAALCAHYISGPFQVNARRAKELVMPPSESAGSVRESAVRHGHRTAVSFRFKPARHSAKIAGGADRNHQYRQ